MNLIWLVLLLVLQSSPQASQPQDVASVEGFVLKIGTTDPIARARVVLTRDGAGPASSITATSDGGGKFVLQNIQPGRYRLVTTRDGFVRAEYGQRGPTLPGTPITLLPKQEMKDVWVQLTPTGAIAGRVYDRFGDPVGNANVQALRYTYQDGRRVLSVVQSARTNDLGEYRLFWMQPGLYIVSAVPSDNRFDSGMMFDFVGPGAPMALTGAIAQGGAIRVGGNPAQGLPAFAPPVDTGETYLPVYFPGTTDVSGASPVDVRPGANYTGVDLTVVDTRAVRIRGRVVSNRMGVGSGGSISLIARGTVVGGIASQRLASVSTDGAFEFRGITPGSYDLVATSGRQMITFSESGSSAGGPTASFPSGLLQPPHPVPVSRRKRRPRRQIETPSSSPAPWGLRASGESGRYSLLCNCGACHG